MPGFNKPAPTTPASKPAPKVAPKAPTVAAPKPAPKAPAVAPVKPQSAVAAKPTPTAETVPGSNVLLQITGLVKYSADGGKTWMPIGEATMPIKAPAPTAAPKLVPAPKPAVPAPKVAPVVQQNAAPPSGGGDLAKMTRKEMIPIARSLGLQTEGLLTDDLRNAILAAQQSAGDDTSATEQTGSELDELSIRRADIVARTIEDNFEQFEAVVTPDLPMEQRPEGYLGCNGNCRQCPNPEGYADASGQIAACYLACAQGGYFEMEPDLAVEAAA